MEVQFYCVYLERCSFKTIKKQTLHRGDLIGTTKEENALEEYDPMTPLVSLLLIYNSFPSIGE